MLSAKRLMVDVREVMPLITELKPLPREAIDLTVHQLCYLLQAFGKKGLSKLRKDELLDLLHRTLEQGEAVVDGDKIVQARHHIL